MLIDMFKKGTRSLLNAMPASWADASIAGFGRIARLMASTPPVALHPSVRAVSFGIEGSHCFFGYYDITPFDELGTRLLAGRATKNSASRAAGTLLEVGTFNSSGSGEGLVRFGQTTTWCWQQGCRLQWLSALGRNWVIYNRSVGGAHGAVIQDTTNGTIIRELPAPVYAVNPDGRTAVSLNFSRLQRLRPGYGYDDLADPTGGECAPNGDGLWRIDLETGERVLLLSLADATRLHPRNSMRDAEHYFNHVSWNPSGTRFLVFHLWQAGRRRFSRAMTLPASGGTPFLLTDETHVSHYCWLDDCTVLLTSTHHDTGTGFHVYRDGAGRTNSWQRAVLPVDGHPSLSPNGRWLVCDTLPNLRRERMLFVYDIETGRRVNVGSFYTPPALKGERRCDLHPRWNRDGTMVCVDASHTAVRTMMTLDVTELVTSAGAGAWKSTTCPSRSSSPTAPTPCMSAACATRSPRWDTT